MTHSHRVRLSKLSLGLIVALAAAPAFAQSTSAGVGGQVTGAGGQPVAGAEVTIVHTESGTVSRATTDASGRYNARGLRVGGPYTIVVTKAGAGTDTEEDVYLSLSQVNTINAELNNSVTTLGTVQAVGTAGAASVFSSNKMGAGTNVSQEQIEALPSINRNIQDYVRLDPRVAQSDKSRGELSVGGQNPRYNAIRIDGVNTSDTFGLESNNFPTIRQPVSMDAIEAINVDISNYDVTITGATGAVIDAVTKSGTNEFHGSVYGVFRNKDMVGDNVVSGAPYSGFNEEVTYGATFGGPILKDTLFFFANYEKFTRDRPASSYGPIGSSATNIVNITDAQVKEAQQIAQTVYGVDIGSLEAPSSTKLDIEEYALKLDWNISDNHRASARYSKMEQVDPIMAGAGTNSLSFDSRWYAISKNVETGVAQLFSDWTTNFSTEFKVGQRKYDSLSTVNSRLPSISIGFGNGTDAQNPNDPHVAASPYLNFGADEFRHGNQVNTKTTNLYGGATWYIGDHTVKFGADWESNDIFNMYAQNIWGSYTFASLEHFRKGEYAEYRLNAPVPGNSIDSINMQYVHRNLGLFLQDSWAVNYNLTLLAGLRVDMPDLDEVPFHNQLVQTIYGLDNRNTLDKELIQPRFGFNYTFDSELPMQLRGGMGLFQGSAANVWVGNSYQNYGFGLIGYNAFPNGISGVPQAQREAVWANLPARFDPDNPTTPNPAAGYTMFVNLMEKGIEQPSVWKANLAYEMELPWHGVIASAEYIRTQVNKGIHFERLDLGAATGVGQDGRDLFWRNVYGTSSGTRANGGTFNGKTIAQVADTLPGYENVSGWHGDGVIYMKNTDKGRSDQLTFALNKPLTDTWGWMLGYTYTDATEVGPLTSSRAISQWSNKAVFHPNEEVAATSNYEVKDRFTGALYFKRAFFGDYATKVSLFYEGRSGLPYSWRYLNDANGDGYTNDLIYVPSGPGDVKFSGGAAMETAFFQWLGENPELARYAGGVAERNANRNPWVNNFDLRVTQELPGLFEGHKSEVWVDVMNVGNLLNKDWGRITYQSPYSDMRAIRYVGVDQASGKYIYNFAESAVWNPAITDFESRWSVQVGFKYRF